MQVLKAINFPLNPVLAQFIICAHHSYFLDNLLGWFEFLF